MLHVELPDIRVAEILFVSLQVLFTHFVRIEYLSDTYTQDLVFANWNTEIEEMESTFGESFEEIYKRCTACHNMNLNH